MLKKGPNTSMVSTKSVLSPQAIEILKHCAISRSLLELMSLFKLSDRSKFRNKYISGLIDEGLLELTVPDKPNSSNQKYVTTAKGKKAIS